MNPNQTEPELPKFQDMPEPACVLKVSWEDAAGSYRTVHGRYPDREATLAMFAEAERIMGDRLIEDFWLILEHIASEYEAKQ